MTQALSKAGFGWRRAPDPRDNKFPFSEVVSVLAPMPGKRKRHYFKTSRVLDQGSKPSAVISAVIHWILTVGCPIPEGTIPRGNLSSIRYFMAELFSRGLIIGYYWTGKADYIARAVMQDVGPVLLGLYWRRSMDAPMPDGSVSVDGPKVGAHCVLVVGYDSRRGAFRCLNSWGAGWGQRGRFWISYPDMQRLLDEGGEACLPVKA